MTKYVITIVNKNSGAPHALVTRHHEKISEIEDALDEDEIMFVNEYESMKIEDLRINQKVRLVTTLPDWQNVPEVTIVGLRVNEKGEENITVDDGSGYHYDGWKLCQLLPL